MSRLAETGHRPRLNHKDHSRTPWPPPLRPRLGGGINNDSQPVVTAEGAAFREALVFGNAHASAAVEAAGRAAAKKLSESKKRVVQPVDSGFTPSTPPHRGAH